MPRWASNIAAANRPWGTRGQPAWAVRSLPAKALLPAGLRLGLFDKRLAGGPACFVLRIVFGGRLCGDDLLSGFSLLHHRSHAIANGENHVAVRYHGGTVDGRTMAGNNLRVRPCQTDRYAQTFDHSVEATSISAIDVWILNRSIV